MEKSIKLIHVLLTVIIATCLITSTVYSQSNTNENVGDWNKGIVHNDQTGIVLKVVEKNKNQNIITVQNLKTGLIYQSIPTRLATASGERVIFRPLCHCTCKIKAVCGD